MFLGNCILSRGNKLTKTLLFKRTGTSVSMPAQTIQLLDSISDYTVIEFIGMTSAAADQSARDRYDLYFDSKSLLGLDESLWPSNQTVLTSGRSGVGNTYTRRVHCSDTSIQVDTGYNGSSSSNDTMTVDLIYGIKV